MKRRISVIGKAGEKQGIFTRWRARDYLRPRKQRIRSGGDVLTGAQCKQSHWRGQIGASKPPPALAGGFNELETQTPSRTGGRHEHSTMPQIERPLRRKCRQPIRGFEDQRQTLGQVDRCRHGRSEIKSLQSAGNPRENPNKFPEKQPRSRPILRPAFLTAHQILRELSCRRLPERGAERSNLTLQRRGVRRLFLLHFVAKALVVSFICSMARPRNNTAMLDPGVTRF